MKTGLSIIVDMTVRDQPAPFMIPPAIANMHDPAQSPFPFPLLLYQLVPDLFNPNAAGILLASYLQLHIVSLNASTSTIETLPQPIYSSLQQSQTPHPYPPRLYCLSSPFSVNLAALLLLHASKSLDAICNEER